MAQPLYFLPHLREKQLESIPQTRAVLKERGLTDVFADVARDEMTVCELSGRGPGDLSGVILAYKRPDEQIPRRLGFYPKEQAWTPVGDGSQVWLGIDTDEPPTEADLRRKRQYSGYRIELGDGGQWHIPIIRRPDGSTELPRQMKWDPTGRLIEPIKPAYESYWQETEQVVKWAQQRSEVPTTDALELCVRALSINYRFGKAEQNLLGIVDSENWLTLLLCTVDWPKVRAIADALDDPEQKKTTADLNTPSSGVGLPADSPITDLPEATSI